MTRVDVFQSRATELGLLAFSIKEPLEHTPEWMKQRKSELVKYLASYTEKYPKHFDTDALIKRTEEILFTNHLMGLLYSSNEYSQIIEKEKVLRGDSSIGMSICIDGRIVIPFIAGRIAKVHETKAGLVELDEEGELKSDRLAVAINKRAANGDPLLEILFAHTSLSHPDDHGCGAAGEMKAAGTIQGDDLVDNILAIHKKSAIAIDNQYNRAAQDAGKPLQTKTAITAVYDTDSLGILFGYDKHISEEPKYQFSTTQLTKQYLESIQNHFSSDGQLYRPGILKDIFTQPEINISIEKITYDITRFLMQDGKFIQHLSQLFSENEDLKNLNEKQKQALLFTIARTVGIQYITGMYEGVGNPHAHHAEKYQSISEDHLNLGQFDPDGQAFCSSPPTVEEAVRHIITQCNLMDKRNEEQKPYILFVSSAVTPGEQGASSLERSEVNNRRFFRRLKDQPEIRKKLDAQELILVPVLIDDKSRDVIKIPNQMI